MAGIKLLDKKPEHLNFIMNELLNPELRGFFFDDRIGWQDVAALLYDPGTLVYGIFEKGVPVPIGTVILAGIFPYRGCVVNAVLFKPELRHQKKMHKVAAQVLGDLVQQWSLHHLEARTIGENTPASGLLKTLGFRHVGVKPGAVVVGGRYADLHEWYVLTEDAARAILAPAAKEGEDGR